MLRDGNKDVPPPQGVGHDPHKVKITAQIADYLEELANGTGRLTVDRVLTDAARPESPLHPMFEWRDSVAASMWRRHKAESLIRKARMRVQTETTVYYPPKFVRSVREVGVYHATAKVPAAEHGELVSREVSAALGHLRRAAGVAASFSHESEPELARLVKRLEKLLGRLSA